MIFAKDAGSLTLFLYENSMTNGELDVSRGERQLFGSGVV